MNIYSWNMLFKNADLDGALAYVTQADADIFCIQEAPEEFVTRLRKVFPYTVAAFEVDRVYRGVRTTQYVVIVSKWPITESTTVALPDRERAGNWRTKIFTTVLCALRLWALGTGPRHALVAKVATPRGVLQVFNLHLSLSTPPWRAEEFELAMHSRDASLPTVVCGDFNVLEKIHITPLTWLLGGTLSDALFFRRERRAFEERFARHHLTNTLLGKSTHRLSRSQLDHILVSEECRVESASVVEERHHSDHNPVTATFALATEKKLDRI